MFPEIKHFMAVALLLGASPSYGELIVCPDDVDGDERIEFIIDDSLGEFKLEIRAPAITKYKYAIAVIKFFWWRIGIGNSGKFSSH